MLTRLVVFALKVLCEVAALLLIAGVLCLVLAYTLGRRTVIDRPGRLERLTGQGPPPWPIVVLLRIADMVEQRRTV